MKKVALTCFFVVICLFAFAQKFSVKGQLADSLSNPLPSATVMILLAKDSSLVNFVITDANGFFAIRNLTRDAYLLKTTYLGFAPYIKQILPKENDEEINLGQLRLSVQTKQLSEVTVEAERAPVVVKKDTIEFNAASFKTKVNATAEDLIKKLPGMEVEKDGTIRAQGEQVQRVMVEGKEFFGQDPKLATRNLPADAIDKVQVYDKKSDQAVFSGIDDGQREKTINLALKEGKKHAMFGNDMAGAGTESRFQAKSSLNRFNKGNQLSFLGMGNNINEQGFSIGDFTNFNGNSGRGGGGTVVVQVDAGNQGGPQINTGRQNGIVTNYAGGLNLNQSFNKDKTKVSASYFYNHLDQNLSTTLHRINYLPTGNYTFDQHSLQNTINDNHRINFTIDHRIDSANSIKSNVNLSYNLFNQRQTSQGITRNVGSTSLKNSNDQLNSSTGNNVTINSNLLFRHRFAKKGRNISTNLSFAYGSSVANGNLQSKNLFYSTAGELMDSVNVRQANSQTTTSPTIGITTSYTEPLGGRKYLEFNYNFSTDINHVDRPVYDLENETRILNDSLSNKYQSNYVYSRPGVNFRINRDRFTLTLGSAWQQTRLNGNLILKNERVDRMFQAFLPVFHFNYDYSNFKHLRVDYTTSMQEPSIQQLQPVVNNSDQLNQVTGNPLLKPAYAHQFRSNFTFFDPGSFMNFFAFINGNYTTHAIVNSQTTTSQLIRITKPVNVRNSMNVSGNFHMGIPVKALNSRFNLGPNFSASRGINLTNEVENVVSQQTLGGTARYNYSLREILIFDLSANLSRQETKYSFSAKQNQAYFNKTYSAELNLNFLKNYAFNTDLDYFDYTNSATNFHQAIPLWNMSLSRFLLKNKAGEFKVGVSNLLNRSLSVSQTANTNYLQQQTMNNLGRFYMLSFTYALNKELNPAHNRRGVRMLIRD